jgi:hypothetical protein
MAIQMSSPGVYVTEIDHSEIVPSTSASVTVFGGDFTKGPADIYTQITSVDDLVEFYGRPTNSNYNDWYQAYNFLQYGNNLLISRAVNKNGSPVYMNSVIEGLSVTLGYGTVDFGTSAYGESETEEFLYVSKTDTIKVGSILGFSKNMVDAIDEAKTVRYYVTGVVDTTLVIDGVEKQLTAIKLHKPLELPPEEEPTGDASEIEDFYVGLKVFRVDVHHNGSCEALEKGNATNVRVTWKTTSNRFTDSDSIVVRARTYEIPVDVPKWLDGTPRVSQKTVTKNEGDDGLLNSITIKTLVDQNPVTVNGGILFDTNTKVLNPNDWDFKYSNGSIAFATPKSKLKFFSRTPGKVDSLYEISIAVPLDFEFNDDHVGNHCIKYAQPGLPVDGYFEYAPAKGSAQIAVFIYDTVNKEMKETYLCSLDPNEVDSYNNSMFIEKVINRTSNCVYVKCNTATPSTKEVTVDVYDDEGTTTGTTKVIVPNIESYTLTADLNGEYHGHVLDFSCESDSLIQQDDLLNAYEIFDNKDNIDIDIIIANELDNGLSAKKLAETREDCIAFMGIPYSDPDIGIMTVSKRTADSTANIVRFRNKINYNSMWVSLIANYKYQYDRYNDTYRWVNVAGDVAGLRAESTENYAAWWASAGLNRGQIKNVTKLAYAPNKTQIGTLYNAGINAIVTFPGQGTVLWGQKTMLDKASSFDRVNVRGLFNVIERALAKMSKYQVFEFNDVFTRNKIISIINPYLETVKSDRGIQDFMVICDTTNNTPDIISRNQLIVDIYIKPTYVAEFINLRFINCGVNDFSSVIVTNQ